jgi:hypothetical protein
LPKINKKETPGVTRHFADRILSIATFGLLGILATSATATPVRHVTNPYTAEQVQSMLHPSAAAVPNSLHPNTGISTIERLLGPQLQKLRAIEHSSAPVPSQFDSAESQPLKGTSVHFRSVPTWSAAPSGDPSDVYAIAVADFDRRDGPDVVTVQTDGTFNVLYNKGGGNLATSYFNTSAVALNPAVTTIKAADLNGDGYADVVAMDALNSALLIFINKKDGTFSDAASLPVAPASGASFMNGGAFTVGDVNSDGNLDIVAISNLQNTDRCCTTVFSQQTFLGNGDGTFKAPTGIDTTHLGFFSVSYGDTLALAHVYSRKVFDLVLEVGGFIPTNSLSIRVIRGKADGTFRKVPNTGSTASDAQAMMHAGSFALADLNHDGHLDVAFTATDANIYVALADSKGSLQTPSVALSGLYTTALVTAADLNKDGNADLIVFAMGQLAVFTGRGDGTFAAAATGQYAGGSGSNQLPGAADFNADGNLDIATLDRTNNQVAIYRGWGNGRLNGAGVIYPARNEVGVSPSKTDWAVAIEVAAAGDFNAHGQSDVVAYNPLSGQPALDIGTSDAHGRFLFKEAMSASQLQSLAEQYQSISIAPVTADFNADGRADLVLQTFAGLAVSATGIDGTFATPIAATFPVPIYCQPINFLDAGDVNGDGVPDIVAAYAQNPYCPPSESTPTGFFVLLSNGNGGFKTTFQAFGDALYYIKLADFDGDGKLDLALGNVYDSNSARFNIYLLRGKGDGTFDATHPFRPIDSQIITGIVPGDYDGDGKQDLTLLTAGEIGSDGSPLPGTEGVLLLPGHGDFTFGSATHVLPGVISISGQYADFNGDGKLDLAVSLYGSAQQTKTNFGMIVLPNSGAGSFGPATNLLLPYQSYGPNSEVFIRDFNGDGAPDIVGGLGLSSPLFLNRDVD